MKKLQLKQIYLFSIYNDPTDEIIPVELRSNYQWCHNTSKDGET